MIYLVRRGNRLYYGMYPGLLVVAENQVQGGGTEYGANAGHHRHHNAVVPLFLIHLISHAAPDAEIDDKQNYQTVTNRLKSHRRAEYEYRHQNERLVLSAVDKQDSSYSGNDSSECRRMAVQKLKGFNSISRRFIHSKIEYLVTDH